MGTGGGGGGGGWEEGAGGGGRTKDPSAVDDIDASKNSNNDRPSSSTLLQRLLSAHNKVLPWTKSETDALLELARSYDLRWSVIIDRWRTKFANSPTSEFRNVEDLQHRYYEVGSVLIRRRAESIVAREVKRLSREDRERNIRSGRSRSRRRRRWLGGGGGGSAESTAAPASSTAADSKSLAPSAPAAAAAQQQQQQQQQRSESEPVIPPSEVEAVQQLHRQISVDPALVPPLSVPGSGTAHHRGGARAFDLAAERARRAELDRLWRRTKAEEREEEELRAELRMVEAQLRKLKRAGKHVAPAGSASAAPPSVGGGGGGGGGGGDGGGSGTPGGMATHADVRRGSSSAPVVAAAVASGSRASSSAPPPPPHLPMPHPPLPSHRPPLDLYLHTHQSVSASFVDTAPVPTPGTPYLQSGRLFPPAIEGHSGLNNGTLKQMNTILQELNVPRDPIPTKRNCDLYDGVRKDALTLLILQKILLRKEGELNAKREKLLDIQRAAAAVAAAKVEAEKKKKDDEKAEETKSDGKEEGGKAGKVVARTKAKRQRADSSASNQSNIAVAGGGGGAGKGKKGIDGPKKKYQKKPKIDPKSAAIAAFATATVIPPAANAASIPAPGEPTGTMPPPPALPSASNPTVAPTVTSTKEPAAAKPPSSMNAQPQPQLGNSVDTDVNDTSAPVIIPAKIPGKRGRKPKKKQDH
ncbi:LOW QUALITY PROTEIN: hypothetical protein ACHAW5_001774 [Stephanodiscus triporus]|uniref:Myb-like domain-containing protein n=1 Tax=Stephanodiscus triporus TaxID=2934178 RepID=A0ABD3P2U9_9STRA